MGQTTHKLNLQRTRGNQCDVLFLISSLGRGGAERKITLLASSLAATGHSVCIVTLEPRKQAEYTLSSTVRHVVIPEILNDLQEPHRGKRNVISRILRIHSYARCIRKQIRKHKPKQIISIGNREGLYAMAFKTRKSVQTILTSTSTKSPTSSNPRYRLLFWLARIRKTKVITQTKEIEREHREKGFTNLRTIPNPVFIPPKRIFDSNNRTPFRIIAVGRLVPPKSYEKMLEALAILGQNQSDWICKIVGEGPLLDTLQKQARDLGIESKVEFAGWSQDVRSLLNDSDLYLITSFVEGQPNSLLEAMSESLPSVSTDFDGGAAVDLLKNTSAGLVVPVGDTKGIATAIETLMLDPEQRKEMGKKARQVVEPLNIEKVTDRWVQELGLIESGRP